MVIENVEVHPKKAYQLNSLIFMVNFIALVLWLSIA